jgi:hypothetical protein
MAVARQWLSNNRGMFFSVQFAKQQRNSRSVLRCYKQDIWSNELVVEQSSASKNMSTEAENTVGICHQATIGENTAD